MKRKGDLPFDGRVSFFCSWTKVGMASFSESAFNANVFRSAGHGKYFNTRQRTSKVWYNINIFHRFYTILLRCDEIAAFEVF